MFLSIIFFSKTHSSGDASCWQYNIGRSQWLIRSSCFSKHRGTGFESRPGRMCVVEVVHIQFPKLFKCLECAVLSMRLCTMKNPWSLVHIWLRQILKYKASRLIETLSVNLSLRAHPIHSASHTASKQQTELWFKSRCSGFTNRTDSKMGPLLVSPKSGPELQVSTVLCT